MFLVQNHETLDCVLAFEGTHSFNEFGRNLEGAGDGYCGFHGVHKGYADKLYWLMMFSMPKLRPSLSKCNKAGAKSKQNSSTTCLLTWLPASILMQSSASLEPKQVSCTGHSLGGSLCEAAVLAVPKKPLAWGICCSPAAGLMGVYVRAMCQH